MDIDNTLNSSVRVWLVSGFSVDRGCLQDGMVTFMYLSAVCPYPSSQIHSMSAGLQYPSSETYNVKYPEVYLQSLWLSF